MVVGRKFPPIVRGCTLVPPPQYQGGFLFGRRLWWGDLPLLTIDVFLCGVIASIKLVTYKLPLLKNWMINLFIVNFR
jgi:hypothetical protein